jgi:hypothetical protein
MSELEKPSVVFAHGLWADRSSFQKLILTVQADGREAISSRHGLDSLKISLSAIWMEMRITRQTSSQTV